LITWELSLLEFNSSTLEINSSPQFDTLVGELFTNPIRDKKIPSQNKWELFKLLFEEVSDSDSSITTFNGFCTLIDSKLGDFPMWTILPILSPKLSSKPGDIPESYVLLGSSFLPIQREIYQTYRLQIEEMMELKQNFQLGKALSSHANLPSLVSKGFQPT
jgi:hypothetical protein